MIEHFVVHRATFEVLFEALFEALLGPCQSSWEGYFSWSGA